MSSNKSNQAIIVVDTVSTKSTEGRSTLSTVSSTESVQVKVLVGTMSSKSIEDKIFESGEYLRRQKSKYSEKCPTALSPFFQAFLCTTILDSYVPFIFVCLRVFSVGSSMIALKRRVSRTRHSSSRKPNLERSPRESTLLYVHATCCLPPFSTINIDVPQPLKQRVRRERRHGSLS